ncbi:hypothetical protein ACPCHT_14365 [Nucisporomicrobium flavum]|uniref:hypothetical protein n=1 Tax=Nucisporomicrobium flavum TaxID=2785915 RepID=UPI003C3070A2
MGVSDEATQRLEYGYARVRAPQNGPQAGVYASRTANVVGTFGRGPGPTRGQQLRDLARCGRLAEAAAAAGPAERTALTGAAYEVVWPIVFARVTRRMEVSRGHTGCAAGVDRLADDCLDRFHDDVEAVVEDLLAHARQPILNLEGWIAGRLNAATVDGHRRRRGERGALQRPRLPGWLADDLGHDRWLTTLATQMLVWVGVSGTAGNQTWPLEVWAQDRARCTGDWFGSEPVVVAQEVETVLAAMRRRPQWYEAYVERPLGRKQTAVSALPIEDGPRPTAAPLELGDPYAKVEAEMSRLAADAVGAIRQRLAKGERIDAIVVDVIRTVFGGPFTPTIDRAPHDVADPVGGVTGALTDQVRLNRIVATVRDIVGEREG